jgi:hypothetical protein
MKTEKAPGKNGLPPEAYKILVGLGEDVLEISSRNFGPTQISTRDLEACRLDILQSQVIF